MSSYTQLFIGFLLSATIHAVGDYMNIGRLPASTFKYFLLQGVAITVEDFVIWLARGKGIPTWAGKTIGYVWVIVWTCWVTTPWLDIMNSHGYRNGLPEVD